MAATIGFLQAAEDTANLSEYTFSSQNLGAADGDRHIVVGISSRKSGGTTTVTNVTIAGITATITVQAANTSTNTNVAALAVAAVPSGTTGDIVVTFADTMLRCVITAYRVIGSNLAVHDSGSEAATDPQFALDIPAGGAVVGIGGSGASTTATWSNLTEDYDAVTESFFTVTSASDELGEETGRTIIINFVSNTESVGVFASYEETAGGANAPTGNIAGPLVGPLGGVAN